MAKPAHKTLKHLSLLPFSCIKRILDIIETAGAFFNVSALELK